jgi:hypothetical protein
MAPIECCTVTTVFRMKAPVGHPKNWRYPMTVLLSPGLDKAVWFFSVSLTAAALLGRNTGMSDH